MLHPDPHPAPARALSAAAETLGRQAREERAPLDALLARVERLAGDFSRQQGEAPDADPYAPERDAALLLLWRTAWHAYEAAQP
jgi:hypothetical protein